MTQIPAETKKESGRSEPRKWGHLQRSCPVQRALKEVGSLLPKLPHSWKKVHMWAFM